jgi:hypothetical protein
MFLQKQVFQCLYVRLYVLLVIKFEANIVFFGNFKLKKSINITCIQIKFLRVFESLLEFLRVLSLPILAVNFRSKAV